MTIKAVIFDIGNVLLEWNPERFYDGAIGEARRKALFAEVDLHGMNESVDRGQDFRQTIYDTAEANPAFRDDIRLWHDRWIEMASPAIQPSVRALRALRENGVPVFALSNFGKGSFDFACTQYDFLSEFDRPYISGRMGVTKPDPQIYHMVEEDCGLPPETLLFVDDRADNIAVAAARGWQTHLFDGPAGWIDRLVAEELLRQDQAA
ncbi:HAD family hydrolase [Pseudooceanicola sp.]|uniref:HAD family hydrolase n=1 Tax=Pseudooceanicola sp. TaxID=1914328 RepID=UPI0035C6BC60